MTREEMIEQVENTILLIKQNGKDWWDERDIPILEAAIKAMKMEPCEDCISRQAVNDLVDELARAISDERCCISRGRSTATIMQDILDLPPVQPTACIAKISFDGSIWYGDNRINHKREYVDKNVVAWMPLPEPYKVENEDEEVK